MGLLSTGKAGIHNRETEIVQVTQATQVRLGKQGTLLLLPYSKQRMVKLGSKFHQHS